jgi:hypothetical protein
MKERSKERMAELLLEDLLEQIRESEIVRRMLREMTSLPADELLETLRKGFEQLVAQEHGKIAGATDKPESPSPVRVEPEGETEENLRAGEVPIEPDLPFSPQPVAEASPSDNQLAEQVEEPGSVVKKDDGQGSVSSETTDSQVKKEESPAPPKKGAVELEKEIERHIQEIIWGRPKSKIEHKVSEDKAETARKESPVVPGQEAVSSPPSVQPLQRIPVQFTNDDAVYLHAVTRIWQGDEPAQLPFALSYQGIDGRTPVFAVDHDGLRFYLSKIDTTSMNISRTGELLMGKQETIHLQGFHQVILNELRSHGTLLPFEFGQVAQGRREFEEKVGGFVEELRHDVESVFETKWWTLTLSVLDSQVADVFGGEPSPTWRSRAEKRGSYGSVAGQKRFDIKVLERILNSEKRIAESVHETLKPLVARSDIDMVVGFGSGSSEEWKPILKSSYEVAEHQVAGFYKAILDLQMEHKPVKLMLGLAGEPETFSFVV